MSGQSTLELGPFGVASRGQHLGGEAARTSVPETLAKKSLGRFVDKGHPYRLNPDSSSELTPVARAILVQSDSFSLTQQLQKRDENFSNDKNAKKDLEQDVTALTKFIDGGSANPSDEAAARYFRALAQGSLGLIRKQDGLPPDTAAAERALNDLERVMAGNADVSAWGITIPETEYFAGLIAFTDLRSESRAYSYWRRCADSGQGGCMFNLALAYTVGLGNGNQLYVRGVHCCSCYCALDLLHGSKLSQRQ